MVYRRQTSASVEQWLANLRAVQEILARLWLDSIPDIEEDVLVPGSHIQKGGSSRAIALDISRRLPELLTLFTPEQAGSDKWVEEHQSDVQKKVRRCENVFLRGRPLYEVSLGTILR